MRRRLAPILFSAAAFAIAANAAGVPVVERPVPGDVVWFAPDAPGVHAAVIRVAKAAVDSEALEVMRPAREHLFARWTLPHKTVIDASTLQRLVTSHERQQGIDKSRLVLMADASSSAAIVATADALHRDRRELRVRGLVVDVEDAVAWPSLTSTAERWPSLLIVYHATRRDARDSAFDLATRARAAGAAVQLLPRARIEEAANDAAQIEAMTQAWISALELPRVQRFDDAIIAADRGPEHDLKVRDLAQRRAHAVAIAGAGSIAVPGTAAIDIGKRLIVGDDGRIEVRTAAMQGLLEFDAAAALALVFGTDIGRVRLGVDAAAWISHPETAETMLVLPARFKLEGRDRSVLLLRRGDASYSFVDLADARAVEMVAASNDAADHGQAWSLLMAEADTQGSRLLKLQLQRTAPRRGVWWDPSRPGHGIDLQPVEGGHSLVFATFDGAGKSRWYLANGRIVERRFRASDDGLMLMRRGDPLAVPMPDAKRGGKIDIDFSIDQNHPLCRARAASASQLALFSITRDGRNERWCIEPYPLAAVGAEIDVNGTWYGGRNDSGWGLSVMHGDSGEVSLTSALLYYHDQRGWPRWAMGGAIAGARGVELTMFDYALDCTGCARPKTIARELGQLKLRADGWCGEPQLRASIDLVSEQDASLDFRRDELSLSLVSQRRCY